MKKTIYILTFCSFANSDDHLFSETKVFTEAWEARGRFNAMCECAYEECEWANATIDERDDAHRFVVDECRTRDHYTVQSEAYEGYHVDIQLQTITI